MATEAQLNSWTKPSSDTEQDKQDRTERMIREAISDHPEFHDCNLSVYAKGSYPNKTNVRTESDVDIAVQCSDVFYHNTVIDVPGDSYSGRWIPSKLRAEVGIALKAKFGRQVDTSGKVAINVSSSSARVDADVVPCFNYREYYMSGNYKEGAKIFRRDGSCTKNYPQDHLEKGRSKNNSTDQFYKKTVRILKRTANAMEKEGFHDAVPSYLVESLVYNCQNDLFCPPTWVATVEGIIVNIWENTQGDIEPSEGRWTEADDFKYLFHDKQGWSRKDARDFARAAWNFLEFAA